MYVAVRSFDRHVAINLTSVQTATNDTISFYARHTANIDGRHCRPTDNVGRHCRAWFSLYVWLQTKHTEL